MNIGINITSITNESRGIGKYLEMILDRINVSITDDVYYLYTNKKEKIFKKYNKHIILKYVPGKKNSLWIRYNLPKIIKKDKIDVFMGPETILPIKSNGTKYISVVHDLMPISFPNMYSFKDVLKLWLWGKASIRQADKLIAVSDFTASEIIRLCGVEKNKIVRIYNGSGGANKSTASDQMNVLNELGIGKNYFLYVGAIRSNSNKNIETIIKAFEIFAENNKNVYIVLAGKSEDKELLCKCVTSDEIKKRIIFTGYISDELRDILYTNTLSVVYPTFGEGFGFPILEAMNCGVPIIVSSNTSLPEVGGDAAIYLKNESDESELACKMEWVLNLSDAERQKIIQSGYEQAAKFSWEKCVEETLKVLTEK